MRLRWQWVVILGLLCFVPRDVAAAEVPAAGKPVARVSVLVRLAGPSVIERVRQLGVMGAALDTRAAAQTVAAPLVQADAAVARAQAPVAAGIEALGGQVVGRYTTVANGLLVHATSDQVRAMRELPGVAAVEPAPLARPRLRQSVPYIGAPQLGRLTGYHGEGTVIAVVDTGIDYTHADFGGPGTVDAYAAAASQAETIDDTWQGVPLFPTAKVVGGWDFVGPNYSSPTGCLPELEAAGKCTTTPHPDPDPLDQYGHGSHVAGIAAGSGVDGGAVAPGVAPAAALVALKIYGPPQPGVYVDEAVDVLVDTLEWCARVNLGLPVPGVAPDHVDVVNMSLGEDYDQGSRLFDDAIAAVTDVGIVVVAAAGNSGDVPYIVNAPGASPKALAVANVLGPGTGITVPATWGGAQTSFVAVEARATPVLRLVGPIVADLVWLDDSCEPAPPGSAAGRVALVDGGGCSDAVKITAAETAGAQAALVVGAGPAQAIQGPANGSIPAFSVGSDVGATLRPLLTGDIAVQVVLDADNDVAAGILVSGSARGPGRHGTLKPDIAAPGSGIFSAGRGQGSGGAGMSGTSMASPHVAGAVALLAQRNRSAGLRLRALDLAALLMNYAAPASTGGPSPLTAPVTRQGAGRLDVAAAGTATLLVRSGDIAAVNLGLVAPRRTTRYRETLSVRNLADASVRLRPTARFYRPDDEAVGVSLSLPDEVWLPAQGVANVPVVVEVAPARLRDWALRGLSSVGSALQGRLEVDGDVTLVPVDDAGAPRADLAAPHVPFYVLPRAAASVWATSPLPAGATADRLLIENPLVPGGEGAAVAGRAELFAVPGGGEEADADDAAGELDVWRVGVRFEPAAGPTAARLTIGVALRRPAVLPALTRFELYLDTDGDGMSDRRARSVPESEVVAGGRSDRLVVALSSWDPATGQTVGPERVVADLGAEMHGRVVLLPLPLSDLGLVAPRTVSFFLLHRGLTEDWLGTTAVDVVPDGADLPGGPRLVARPEGAAPVASQRLGGAGRYRGRGVDGYARGRATGVLPGQSNRAAGGAGAVDPAPAGAGPPAMGRPRAVSAARGAAVGPVSSDRALAQAADLHCIEGAVALDWRQWPSNLTHVGASAGLARWCATL